MKDGDALCDQAKMMAMVMCRDGDDDGCCVLFVVTAEAEM
jgi:hypothetical protein